MSRRAEEVKGRHGREMGKKGRESKVDIRIDRRGNGANRKSERRKTDRQLDRQTDKHSQNPNNQTQQQFDSHCHPSTRTNKPYQLIYPLKFPSTGYKNAAAAALVVCLTSLLLVYANCFRGQGGAGPCSFIDFQNVFLANIFGQASFFLALALALAFTFHSSRKSLNRNLN